ncbi:2'-5' RNA ligase [Singulisphaera sp. GP187]|uniref:RNA 2',3'-cyclic phosphodiesterase n=1 Tax=Singulisphaera sp. GP187 TaxID=1882752 RepID=UPI00092AD6F1|nr:RNA 2',3'-cyclic phosphodiesterase [Singulisphaera sp. GP187]SIN99186.1 2'-5' RNA ligase [Singulisphaera sp. GP187]
MRTTRTFIAIPVPDALGTKLTRLQTLLAPDLPGVRWSVVSPFHLTLAFLGDVEDTELNKVCRTVEEVAADFPPFDLLLEGLGVFPNSTEARVIWVGLSGSGLSVLHEVREALASALAKAGYRCDETFTPHVTLGRLKRSRGEHPDLTRQLNHFRTWAAGLIHATELVSFASGQGQDGPEYSHLARAQFRGKKRRSVT